MKLGTSSRTILWCALLLGLPVQAIRNYSMKNRPQARTANRLLCSQFFDPNTSRPKLRLPAPVGRAYRGGCFF